MLPPGLRRNSGDTERTDDILLEPAAVDHAGAIEAEAGWQKPPRSDHLQQQQQEGTKRKVTVAALAVTAALVLCIGFGVGFGAGFGVGYDKGNDDEHSVQSVPPDYATTNINLLREFVRLNVNNLRSEGEVVVYYDQMATLEPSLAVFSSLLSSLGNKSYIYDPMVLRIYLGNKYGTDSVLFEGLYRIGQRIQGIPHYQDALPIIFDGMNQVFAFIRENVNRLSSSPSRSLMADTSINDQLLKALISEASKQDGPLYDPYASLTTLFEPKLLLDLILDVYNTLRNIVAELDLMAGTADAYHGENQSPVAMMPTDIIDLDSVNGTLGDIIVKPLAADDTRGVEGELQGAEEDIEEGGNATLSGDGGRHRRLLAPAVLGMLPGSFQLTPSSLQPNVLIPVCFHIMMYSAGAAYGPPQVSNALAMAQRMVNTANNRFAPAKFQFFINTDADGQPCVRNDPIKYPYLLKSDRTTWLNCARGYFYDKCGDAIQNSAYDFPRTLNFYIVGENPPTDYVGYAFVPGDNWDPLYGHIVLTWTAFTTDGLNSQSNYDSGTQVFVHEVMHHLGMPHTFSEGGAACTDDGIPDTVTTAGPVWSQSFAQRAYIGCVSVFRNTYRSQWALVNAALAVRVGLADDQLSSFGVGRSCPGRPCPAGMSSCVDEVGNYLTYSYDPCYAAVGHMSAGQIAKMHTITEAYNPEMYTWGQYYAQQAAAAAAAAATQAPVNPQPSVGGGTQSGGGGGTVSCSVRTAQNCVCLDSWSLNGTAYKGCASVPSVSSIGVCAVDRSAGDCPSARNGWWDACNVTAQAAVTAKSECNPTTPAPTVAPTPSPTPKPVSCGAGARTAQGYTCASTWSFKIGRKTFKYSGCANPNKDEFKWCVLANNQKTPTGKNWDYCHTDCNTNSGQSTSSGTLPSSLGCTSKATGLPNGCTCKSSWSLTFAATGAAYKNMLGCTQFQESPKPLCQLSCRTAANNNKISTCACPAKKL